MSATGQSPSGAPVTRRAMLKGMACAAAAAAVAPGARSPGFSKMLERFIRRHFREMSKEELARNLKQLEQDYTRKYGRAFTVEATPPLDNTLFAYALDIGRCIGCRRCVYGCVEENNQSRDPQVHWITVLEMDKEKGVDLHYSTPYYDRVTVPAAGKFYVPVQCQQCRNPPCVKVCPVRATWQEPDGIVTVDYDWCVGCRCCLSACPYGARHFNWKEPHIPSEAVNPNTEYLGNRPRPRGVVEKCTFCIQRVRKGRYPKCVEVCPVGARKFGNLLDPESEVRQVLERKRVLILKADLNTQPKFYYFYGV